MRERHMRTLGNYNIRRSRDLTPVHKLNKEHYSSLHKQQTTKQTTIKVTTKYIKS